MYQENISVPDLMKRYPQQALIGKFVKPVRNGSIIKMGELCQIMYFDNDSIGITRVDTYRGMHQVTYAYKSNEWNYMFWDDQVILVSNKPTE